MLIIDNNYPEYLHNQKNIRTFVLRKVRNDINVIAIAWTKRNPCSPTPDKQLQVLKALAKEGKTATPNKGTFIQKYSLKAASTVSSALSALIDKELVYRSPDGYSVYDRFLEIWLRELWFFRITCLHFQRAGIRFMFRSAVSTFRSGERTFRSAEHRLDTCSDIIIIALVRTLW